jgi:hypothetical protein
VPKQDSDPNLLLDFKGNRQKEDFTEMVLINAGLLSNEKDEMEKV